MTLAPEPAAIGRVGTSLAPKNIARNCRPQLLATSQFSRSERASPILRNELVAIYLPDASHASDASRTCLSRTRVPAAASPKECRYATRIQFLQDTLDLPNAVSRPWPSASEPG